MQQLRQKSHSALHGGEIQQQSQQKTIHQFMEPANKKTFSDLSYSSKLIELKQQLRSLPSKDQNIKIDITKSEYPLLRNVAQNELHWKIWGKKDQKDDANIIWLDTYVTEEFVRRLKPYQKVNHFSSSHQLGKKSLLTKNISQMSKIFPKQYDFYPRTWLLPEQNQEFQKFQLQNPQKYYIIKPPASCQGRGIYLTKHVSIPSQQKDQKQIRQWRQRQYCNKKGQQTVVQQYIQKPFLIDNLKFDFRIYVLIKSVCPLKIFVYKEGLTRLATKQYCEPEQINEQCLNMHLTNYAINKITPLFIQNKNFEQDNLGHKRSYSSAIKILGQHGCDTVKLQQQIDQIIIKTVISSYSKLVDSYRSVRDIKQQTDSVCFEILGFDILVTSDFTPKLIEVNHSPSFCTDTPLDYIIKKYLVLDTLNLINVDSQAKLDFIKKRSMENTNKNWFRVNQIKDASKMTKVIEQIYQNQHLGGFRKIFPIKRMKNISSSQSTSESINSIDAIFNKVNQQYIVKRIKQNVNNQVIDISKYRKRKQRRSLDQNLHHQYQTMQFELPSPPALVSDVYRDLNFKTFSFTYYNIAKRNQKKEQPAQTQNIQIDQQIKRHISPLKTQTEKQKSQTSKKYQVPIKMKNTRIDFAEQSSKKKLLNDTADPTKPLQLFDRGGRVFSTPPLIGETIKRKLYQCYDVRDTLNKQEIISKTKQKQVYFDNELRERISKMKMARVRLHKIKRFERNFIGNSFRGELDTLKL